MVALALSSVAAAWTPTGSQLNHRRWHTLNLRADRCLNTWTPKPLRQVASLPRAWDWWGGVKQNTLHKHTRCEVIPRTIWNDFLCIHSYEGAWNDTGDPYWGGLQMDRSFMATYGADMIRRYNGLANVWPPSDQILVAYRAWKVRGFSPWPATARMCGLL